MVIFLLMVYSVLILLKISTSGNRIIPDIPQTFTHCINETGLGLDYLNFGALLFLMLGPGNFSTSDSSPLKRIYSSPLKRSKEILAQGGGRQTIKQNLNSL